MVTVEVPSSLHIEELNANNLSRFNLKCLVHFLEGEGRGANFIAMSKLSLY